MYYHSLQGGGFQDLHRRPPTSASDRRALPLPRRPALLGPPPPSLLTPVPSQMGFTKLPECAVISLMAVLGFHWQWGWGVKRLALIFPHPTLSYCSGDVLKQIGGETWNGRFDWPRSPSRMRLDAAEPYTKQGIRLVSLCFTSDVLLAHLNCKC